MNKTTVVFIFIYLFISKGGRANDFGMDFLTRCNRYDFFNSITVNTNLVCLNGIQPIVTFQALGNNGSYDFVYSINGGIPITIHSISGTATLTVPTDVAGTYEYKLLSYSDSVGTITSVNQSVSIVIDSVVVPDTQMNGTGKFVYNGTTVFKICGNSSAEFEFVNASTTTGTNTNYTIDWGDGTVETISSWTLKKHTYAVGYYNLVYSITNSAGCSATQTYKVFLGSNPAVGFTAALNADICVGSTLSFPLTGTSNNPPGTTYEVSFSDGSAENYTQENLPATISHIFDKNSCGYTYVSGSLSIPNSFSGTVKAINPCGTAVVSVGPIFVSSPPKAEITVAKNNCLNTIVCIQNTSKGSVEVSSGTASCDSNPATVWTITPNTGFTLPAGSTLGKDYGSNSIGLWDKGSTIICPTFTVAGTYTIKMRVGNRCGVSETTTMINVDVPLVPQFSLDSNVGCTPLIINTTNTTVNTNISDVPTYQWTVTYVDGNCGSGTPTWGYVSSTNQNSVQPKFNFTTSGIYQIKLSAINSCGAVGTTLQEVQVVKKAEVSINPVPSVCQDKVGEPVLLSPTAIVKSCTASGTPVDYAWSFPGGTPTLSTDANPKVSYMPGTYTISLSVTNQCGVTQATDVSFTVEALPNLVITNPSSVCAPTTVDLYDGKIKNGSDANLEYSYWADDKATIPLDKPYQIALSGTYYIKATHKVTGCFVIQPVTVVVNPITTIIGDLDMCLGGTAVQLQTNPIHTLVSPWTSSDPTVATISNSGLINSVAVGHTDITYTDERGCAFTKTFYVNTLVNIKKNPEPTQTICVGGVIPPLVVDYNGGAGTPKYEWYSNTVLSNSGGTLIPEATTLQFTPQVFTTSGKYYYYAVISLSSSGCGTAATDPAEVIVLDNIKVTTQPIVTQTLCRDATPTSLHVVVSGGATGAYSYQWYKNTINSDVGGRIIPFEIYDTYTPPTTNIGVVYYYCVITQVNNGCNVNSQPAKVEIVVPPTITLNPVSGGVCLGTVAKPLTVSYTDGAGIPSYQWYATTSTLPQLGNPINGATNASFIPPSSSLGTFYYYCVILFTGSGGCTAITSEVAKIIVSTYPIISPITVFTCSGIPFEIVPQDGTGNVVPTGTTYTWDYPVVNIANSIQGAEARKTEQSVIQQNLINSSTTRVDVIYSVTPNSGGCIGANFIVTAQVNPDIVINPITTPIKCAGANDASIVLNISGGTAPYKTTWSNLAGGVSQNNLSAGDYTVIVTDAEGCTRTTIITLSEPPVFKVDATVKEISCHGANNGSINLNVIGGKAPLKLIWSDNALSGKERNNLAPGVYLVAVSDGTGCTINRTFVLLDPQELVVTANITNAFDCTNANSGAINLLVSGGTAPYAYQWSNGIATKDVTSISAGNYAVKVSDSRGCIKETSYYINRQDPIEIKVQTDHEVNCDTKEVKQKFIAHVSGGVAPYQLNWLSGQVSGDNNEVMTTFQNGTVILEVKDGLGCGAIYSSNVKLPILGIPGFNVDSFAKSVYGFYSIKDPIHFINTATDFETMVWDFGDGTTSTELNPVHSYLKEGEYLINQKTFYPLGCVYNYSSTLKITKGYEVIIPNAFSPNNNGINDTFKAIFKGLNKIKMELFNTWGGMLFSEEGTSLKGWTGMSSNGSFLPNGNYYYKIIATTFYGDEIEYNNPFILIR